MSDTFVWKKYFGIEKVCAISYHEGSDDFLLNDSEKIYKYRIDKETLEPELYKVIFNYMSCIFLICSPSKEVYISYKVGQEDFMIY